MLLSRVIIAFNLNLYMPMSKNDANMETAHEEDAAKTGKFFFRKQIIKPSEGINVQLYHSTSPAIRSRSIKAEFDAMNFPTGEDSNDYDLMNMNDIINGKSAEDSEEGFPGILPLVHAYLDLIECSGATRDVLNCYLDLVRLRASGELVTCAQWMRGFIVGHKDYKKDSVITPEINNDLIDACLAVSDGTLVPEEFLGRLNSRMQSVLQNLADEVRSFILLSLRAVLCFLFSACSPACPALLSNWMFRFCCMQSVVHIWPVCRQLKSSGLSWGREGASRASSRHGTNPFLPCCSPRLLLCNIILLFTLRRRKIIS